MDKEELAEKLMAVGRYLVMQNDDDLGHALGSAITEWTHVQEGGWSVEVVVASLIDTLAYMIAEYGLGNENDRRMLLGATSAGLTMLGSDFIAAKAEDEAHRRSMN